MANRNAVMDARRAATDVAGGVDKPHDPAPRRRLAIFAVVATALLMSTIDATIVATALHDLQLSLRTSVTLVGWTVTAYSLGLVLMLSLAGELTQRFGARRVFLASVALFTAASLCCGLVDDIYALIVLRCLQAIGGAGFTPSATRIIVTHFGHARDKAVGLFGSFFTTGALIGPLLGAVIVSAWPWRGVFFVNVPIGLALIPLCLRFVPADPPRRKQEQSMRIDLAGAALLGIGLLGVMIGLTLLGSRTLGSAWPWIAALACAVCAIAAFGWHVERVRDPLIAPRLIYGRGFAAVNLVNILYGGAGAGLVALIPLYATNRYGIDTLGSGTLLAWQAAGAIALSTAGAFALRRTGYRMPLYAAAVIVALGMLMLGIAPIGLSAYQWLAIAAALVGIGIGWSSPASRNAGLQLVPEQAAALAALRSTGMQVGTLAAVSIATAVMSRAHDPYLAQAWVYIAYAGLILIAGLSASARVPDHRGAW